MATIRTTVSNEGGRKELKMLTSVVTTVTDDKNSFHQISVDFMTGTGENYRKTDVPQCTVYENGKFLVQADLQSVINLIKIGMGKITPTEEEKCQIS